MNVHFRHADENQLHNARSFRRAPDAGESASLLAEIATAPCSFGPAPADLPLALYGAGSLGRLAREFLRATGQEVALVIDRDASRISQEPYWANVPLLHPDDVPENARRGLRVAVCVATAPFAPIEQSLAALGFRHIVPFYDLAESFRHLHPLPNGWFAPPLFRQEQNYTAEILARWADDMSRAHHLQFIAWRRLREEWTFAMPPPPDCDRFFIPEIAGALRGDETFVDAGAHHGSVIEAFLRRTNRAFRKIIAVEPDAANRARLAQQLNFLLPSYPGVGILDVALGEYETDAPFCAGLGHASQLSSIGRTKVPVRPLDRFDLSPSFVKLHLEGGELSALKGARRTLLTHRPIVAVTVYHNADGIWRTPLWLMHTLPDYRFLFRAHSWCGTDAVVYAIPNERCAD
jgi:FkbM family methyltransferase